MVLLPGFTLDHWSTQNILTAYLDWIEVELSWVIFLSVSSSWLKLTIVSYVVNISDEYRVLCGNIVPGFKLDIETGKAVGKMQFVLSLRLYLEVKSELP